VTPVSEIKLIRTDTTLDLSQKAEKVCLRMDHIEVLGWPLRARVVGAPSCCIFFSMKEDSEHVRVSQAATNRRNDSAVRSSGGSESFHYHSLTLNRRLFWSTSVSLRMSLLWKTKEQHQLKRDPVRVRILSTRRSFWLWFHQNYRWPYGWMETTHASERERGGWERSCGGKRRRKKKDKTEFSSFSFVLIWLSPKHVQERRRTHVCSTKSFSGLWANLK